MTFISNLLKVIDTDSTLAEEIGFYPRRRDLTDWRFGTYAVAEGTVSADPDGEETVGPASSTGNAVATSCDAGAREPATAGRPTALTSASTSTATPLSQCSSSLRPDGPVLLPRSTTRLSATKSPAAREGSSPIFVPDAYGFRCERGRWDAIQRGNSRRGLKPWRGTGVEYVVYFGDNARQGPPP